MKERPIIFRGPMVRAILDGRKTQTRRVVKPQPPEGTEGAERQIAALTCVDAEPGSHFWRWLEPGALSAGVRCRYGQPGDRLWVRETWTSVPRTAYWHDQSIPHVERGEEWAIYRASWERCASWPWRSSRFMPRWASRITLEVTGVRVERVQDISRDDMVAEGVEPEPTHGGVAYSVAPFADLWDETNGKRAPWESNPWVWVVEFRRALPGHDL